MKINVYCPECAKKGYKKKLLEVSNTASGIIYPWCKCCKKNVEVDLNKKECLSAVIDL